MLPAHVKKTLSLATLLSMCFLILASCPVGASAFQTGNTSGLAKVCLQQNVPRVTFALDGQYSLVDAGTGQYIDGGQQGGQWTVENINESLIVSLDGRLLGLYQGPLRVEETSGAVYVLGGDGTLLQADPGSSLPVTWDLSGSINYGDDTGRDYHLVDEQGLIQPLHRGGLNLVKLEKNGQMVRYRGGLEIKSAGAGLTVTNILPLEQYLYGVVPAEMPASFPLEALKAQAVVARSYFLSQKGSPAVTGFDVVDTQVNQVYGGYDRENPVTNRAVDETKGLVLVNGGQPVAAFYHASSGGYTENSEDVWLYAVPYIKAKPDPADFNDKYYYWQVYYTADQLTSIINSQLKKYPQPGQQAEFSLVTDLQELEYTTSGQRVKRMLIEGLSTNNEPQQVMVNNADQVRLVLGLNSALFMMQKEMDADDMLLGVQFTGSGWGHGLGLSQWGACGLAREGYNFQQILQYYYTDVDLVANYG